MEKIVKNCTYLCFFNSASIASLSNPFPGVCLVVFKVGRGRIDRTGC